MNLAKKYKQLFEGKVRSNDLKLLKEDASAEIDKLIDYKEVQKANDYDGRDESSMYDQGEEIIIPLLTPLSGLKESTAEVYKDTGFTSFSLDSKSLKALEAAGIDKEDFDEWMTEVMF